MNKIISIILISLSGVIAQTDDGFYANFGGNIVNRHIWRGLEIGATSNSPAVAHVQPYSFIGYQINDFHKVEIGFLGTYGLSNEYSESDFALRYYFIAPFGEFIVQLFDYHYPFKGIDFYNFDNDGSGAHTLEISLGYILSKKVPLNIFVSNNIYNVREGDNTLNSQISYPFEIQSYTLNLFVGGALGESSWHVVESDGLAVTNFGFSLYKALQISKDLAIPVWTQWTYNPHLERSYIQVGLSI